MPSLSIDLEASLHFAIQLATERQQPQADLSHLLLALLKDTSVKEVLRVARISERSLSRALRNDIDSIPQTNERVEEANPTVPFQRVIQRAVLHVQNAAREEVTGANVLVALFTEKDSKAVQLLNDMGLTRLDVVSYITHGIVPDPTRRAKASILALDTAIQDSAVGAPAFRVRKGKIGYKQAPAGRRLEEYKAAAKDRSIDLRSLCALRGNEQPQLKILAGKYSDSLEKLSRTRGAYQLLLLGEEIRSLLKCKGGFQR